MQKYILILISVVLFSNSSQASRYTGCREWNRAEAYFRSFLGYNADWRALHIICVGDLTSMSQRQALVLQPAKNFDNGTALATALAWAADPAFAADPKGYATRKIAEEDPVAMAAKAEAARLEAECQAAEAAAAEALRVLEQEQEQARTEAARLATETDAASATTADEHSQDGSDRESTRTSCSPLSIAETPEKLCIRAPAEQTAAEYAKTITPDSTPLRPTRNGIDTPSLFNVDGTPKRLSRFAQAAARAKPAWEARKASACTTSRTHGESSPEEVLTAQILSNLVSAGIPQEVAVAAAAGALRAPTDTLSKLRTPAAKTPITDEDPTPEFTMSPPMGPSGRVTPPLYATDRPEQF